MNDPLHWLQERDKGPTIIQPKQITWERGPINPETGAAHSYTIGGYNPETNPEAPEGCPSELHVLFQNGVMTEVGANGITPQALLEILIDRFEGFQSGPFACEENDLALTGMREAHTAILSRMANREQRGVLNTMQK